MIDTLVGLGARIFENFAGFMNELSTRGIYLDGQFYSYLSILFGAAVVTIIVAIMVKWVVDFIT